MTDADLPHGGGGVTQPGDAFSPNLAMGGASYTLPFDLPIGPGGANPKLDLVYNTNFGSSGFGVGWQLSLPFVQRARKAPLRPATGDEFSLSGAGALVPVGDGTYVPFIGDKVQTFGFDGAQWTTTTPELLTMRFGADPASRITGPDRVWRWLVDQITFPAGLVVNVEYLADGAQRYVSALRWSLFRLEFTWTDRPDPFSAFDGGFELRTTKRCTRVELHRAGLPVSTLMRSYAFTYDQAEGTGASLLTSMQISGWRAGDDGELRETALRPVQFGYTPFQPERGAIRPMRAMSVPPPALDEQTTLFDYRGTALPGVLRLNEDGATYWENRGDFRWGPPQVLAQAPRVSLSDAGVRFADLTGTGTADLLVPPNLVYPNDPEQGLQAPRAITLAPTFDFGDPASFLVDLDGDRVADLLTFRNNVPIGMLNNDGQTWSDPFVLDTQHLDGLDPDSGRLRFADMNGDGVVDMVLLRSRGIQYWPYLGAGRWGEPRSLPGTPDFDLRPGAGLTVLLTDLNDDGCADLVIADGSTIRIYLNQTGERFADPVIVDRAPLLTPQRTQVADLSGSGSAGLVWTSPGRPGGPDQYWCLDILNGQKPHLLASIDTGYGAVTTIEYGTSARQRSADLDEGRRWTGYLPFLVPVVTRLTKSDSVTGFGESTGYRYHDGHYDRFAHEYLGFAQVDSVRAATANEEEVHQRYYFHNRGTSATDPAFIAGRGQAHRTELYDGAGALRRVDEAAWEARAVPAAGTAWLAIQASKTSSRRDGGVEYESERIDYAYDGIGNVVRESREGRWIDHTGQSQVDRRVIETSYAVLPSGGLTGLASEQLHLDGNGALVKLQRNHYDGDALVGLALGQVTRGWRTRVVEAVLDQATVQAGLGGVDPLLASWYATENHPRFGPLWLRDAQRYRFDALGNHVETRNPNGCTKELVYDADQLHPVRFRENSGRWRQIAFDPIAQQLSLYEDRNANTTKMTFDGLGYITRVWRLGAPAGSPTEVYEYDRAGVPMRRTQRIRLEHTDPTPTRVQHDDFDGSGTVVQTRVLTPSGQWAVAKQQLAGTGRRTLAERAAYYSTVEAFEPAPDAPVRHLFYDFAARPVREELYSGAFTRHTYERNVVRFYDPMVSPGLAIDPATPPSRANRFDAWSRLVAIEEYDTTGSSRQLRGYDALDRLISITDPLGHRILSTVYDLAGRKIRVDGADTGVSVVLFDAADNELRRTDADGRVTWYERGDCGRVEQVRAGGPTGPLRESYTYDGGWGANLDGRVARVEGDFGAAEYSYSAEGDPVEIRRTFPGHPTVYTTKFAYNTQRKLTALTYPDGTVLTVERDSTGAPIRLPGYIDGIEYTAGGARSRVRYANGLQTDRGLSLGDELLTALTTTRLADGVTYQALTYHLDAIGQVLAIDDVSTATGKLRNPQTFQYDPRGRLVGATGRQGPYSYQYDELGNLVFSDESFGALRYGHQTGDAAHPNRLVQRAAAPGPEYLYDNSGNLVGDPDLGTLTYDERGRLVAIVKPDGTRIELVYDQNHRRVLTRRTDAAGTTVRYEVEGIYLVEPDRTVKVIFDEEKRLAIVPSTGDPLLHHLDRLGNVNVISNLRTGDFVGQNEYTPYGQVSASIILHPAYTLHGAEFTDGTDLVLLGARYYRPVLGRFITGDLYLAVNSEKITGFIIGANLYVYGHSNPMNYTDPTGQFVFLVVLLIAVVVGMVIGAIGAAMNGVKTWDEFLLMVVAGGIGGALAVCGFYLFGIAIGIAGAAALANFAFWATVVWSGLGLIGALLTPTLDEHENWFTNSLSFLLKWTHSPIFTTVGIFVMIVAAIAGSKVSLRKGMIFVEVGQGGSAITLGAICYAQNSSDNWDGGRASDLLAAHESVHSRAVAAVGELGFYVTYVAIGIPWGASQATSNGAFGLDNRGCGNPLEKLASQYWSDYGGQQAQTSASKC